MGKNDNFVQSNDTIEGSKVFVRKTEYDLFGRVKKETYPTGYYTLNEYDKHSILTSVKDGSNRLIWQVLDENAKGQITLEKRGNKQTYRDYDTKGFPTCYNAVGINNMSWSFNNKGNLTSHYESHAYDLMETFEYDLQNRLTNQYVYNPKGMITAQSNIVYDSNGNISQKSDLGNVTLAYGANGKPHALTSISGVPAKFPTDSLSVTYTDFKKIKTLSEGYKTYSILYGVDEQRTKSVYKVNNVTKETRYYLGDYEEVTDSTNVTKKIHYLPGGAILILTGNTETLYYGYYDYLGSLIALTNEQGQVVERYAYDPWGNRRNPNNWAQPDSRTSWIINRGFTMHEHLDQFGIINMNGRVYDPLTAQFFSPDPYIQAPGNWINYNRYLYCLNNPLKYTDPDGEFWHIIIGAAIGGVVNLVANWNNCQGFWQYAAAFVVGAGAGAATAATGGAAGAGVWAAIGVGAAGGAVTSATNNLIGQTGNNFSGMNDVNWGQVALSGCIGAANGALSVISPINIPFGESGFGLTIAPQIAIGTDGIGVGFNSTLGYNYKGFNAGVNFGGTYYISAAGTGNSGFEGRIGYGIGYQSKHFQAGIGSTYFFSGETSQLNGQVYLGGGKWRVTYENDTWAPVPGLLSPGGRESDRFRTAAVRFDMTGGRLKGLNAGLNIFTGLADRPSINGVFPGASANKYRMGVLYAGYGNARIGINSERGIRGPIQNGFHDMFNYPHFEVLNIPNRLYFGFYSSNPYTLW